MLYLAQAAEAGRAEVLQKLIDYGVLLTTKDAVGNTALHVAVRAKARQR